MTSPAGIALAGLIGLPIGSFLTVVAHRLPAGESVVAPGSRCPSCHVALRAADNVPILSFALRGGRCRSCKEPISWRYPLTEAVTAGLFCLVAARVAGGLADAAYCVLAAALVALCAVDLSTLRLPAPIVYVAAGLGGSLLVAASAWSGTFSHLEQAALAAAVCGAVFLAAYAALPGGLGFGDVRLAVLCGGFLGWLGYETVLVGFLAAFVVGGLTGVVLLASGAAGRRSRVPFGPFLALGTMVAVLWGADLARLWLA